MSFNILTFIAGVLKASDLRQIVDNFSSLSLHSHALGIDGDGDTGLDSAGGDPQTVIFPRFPASNTGFVFSASSTYAWNIACTSSNQDDEIAYPVSLPAGTYRLDILYSRGGTRGIATFSLDGSSIGTIDMYNASAADNVAGSITGISIAAQGGYELKMKMATKNASASAYTCRWSVMVLRRTA